MRCPFLREAQVKSCRASAFRKMILRMPGQLDNERCSSAEYVKCPAAKQHHEDQPSLVHCPFLNESLVQYCAAGSVAKYIPYSEAVLSHCGTESHKYCELYVALTNPEPTDVRDFGATGNSDDNGMKTYVVDDVRVPGWLWYSPNHMWLDVNADGCVHVGIDAFLAKILGSLERLSFVTAKGINRPTVVFTVNGVDLQMVFPNQIHIASPNTYLRTNPSKLFSDPYTLGWLFEGTEVKDASSKKESPLRSGLVSGNGAALWMQDEIKRVTQIAHQLSHKADAQCSVLMADGGGVQNGIVQHLTRDEILHLFNEFFSPLASRRKSAA